MINPRDTFERTRCACQQCVTACRHMPGSLIPQDLERLPVLGDQSLEQWAEQYLRASDGAIVRRESGRAKRIPTLVPVSREDGSCVFLENDRCTVHERSPFGCSHHDTHMNERQGHQVSAAAVVAQQTDWDTQGPYSRLHRYLTERGLVATPVATRRAAFTRALRVLEKQRAREKGKKSRKKRHRKAQKS